MIIRRVGVSAARKKNRKLDRDFDVTTRQKEAL
jgi:hypothetical protein